MAKTFPLWRFTAHGNLESQSGGPGYIEIYEGPPMAFKIRYALQDSDSNSCKIPVFNKYVTIPSPLFSMRVETEKLSSIEGTSALGLLLSSLFAALAPISFCQLAIQTLPFGVRIEKSTTPSSTQPDISSMLETRFTPDASQQMRDNIAAQTIVVRASLKKPGSTRKGL
ncbi:uncharacterized protein Z518_06868 [Rhinocladiella mackenziei CBS 650.93]|uniref:Uncharacterized protein n=1 Tax=Rhinocladiella mackenziei CBS 650.93 TaxID=1442369 RepID=A0A0D2IJ68_9EURO|nr:uncharacterized protein Z518_06868 [Rhinocladiella mackenziei CBS 650.93]KIX03316.1 hypothetical protein Z518_06868 [Rhinocladiella mackenziei CBS 650.93]